MLCIVCTPSFFWGADRVEPPTKFSKKGGLTRPQPVALGGGCWKGGDNFFQGARFAISAKKKQTKI